MSAKVASSKSDGASSTQKLIYALVPFTDALTGKSYAKGDVVTGWDSERVREYLQRGVVGYKSAIEAMELT